MSKKADTSAAWVLTFLLIGIFVGYSYGISAGKTPMRVATPLTGNVISAPPEEGTAMPTSIESAANILVPAVDTDGNGVLMTLVVQKRAGYGETFIDIDNLVFWYDTQESIQTAKYVAERMTHVNTGNTTLVYSVQTNNTSIVGGPSAGAAMTIATIAALTDKAIDKSVIITGTINPDGTIGQVGGVFEKAKAAKAAGATLFLVPAGQSTESVSMPYQSCYRIGGFTYCTTRYNTTTVNIPEAAGISVREVSTVADAEKYFFAG